MGFTNTIQNQPQEKERQTNRTGAKGSKKYYEYVFSLASKAFWTRTHRESYFFVLFSEDGTHSCLCNNLRFVVLYDFNIITSI
ncbi:unnamed protein product [Arabidopsis halleri]